VLFDRIQNAVGCLLMLFGYIPDKGFLSLRGVVTMAAFVLLGIYGYVTVKSGKMQRVTGFRSLITLFLKVSFVLNLFVFIFTTSTMVPRCQERHHRFPRSKEQADGKQGRHRQSVKGPFFPFTVPPGLPPGWYWKH